VKKVVLRQKNGPGTSPGDVLVMTAALESLHLQYPGRFLTGVDTSCDSLFLHNPRVVPSYDQDYRIIDMHYPLVNDSNQRGIHFMEAYCHYLAKELRAELPLRVNRPFLYLSDEEKGWISQVQERTNRPTRFWLVNSGTKSDFTAKGWGHHNYQKLVDLLRGRVTFAQVGARGHRHKELNGVVNLVGWTDLRQLVRLSYHCAGGVGPSTLLQHLCAAWQKPYVCLLGGREPVTWVSYPKQSTLHTMGMLECCKDGACWKSRTVPLGDGEDKESSLCALPVLSGPELVPQCLASISPEEVANVILRYEEHAV